MPLFSSFFTKNWQPKKMQPLILLEQIFVPNLFFLKSCYFLQVSVHLGIYDTLSHYYTWNTPRKYQLPEPKGNQALKLPKSLKVWTSELCKRPYHEPNSMLFNLLNNKNWVNFSFGIGTKQKYEHWTSHKPFFLMSIARVCPWPNIFPVKQH